MGLSAWPHLEGDRLRSSPRSSILVGVWLLIAGLGAGCGGAASTPPITSGAPSQGVGTAETAAPRAPASAVPGRMIGRASYADGRPLGGADVTAIGVEYATEVDARTDQSGNYAATIAQTDGNYRMAAWIEAPFDGQTYRFPLEPAASPDTHFLGRDGISKDFVWKLSGRASWASQMAADDRRGFVGGIIGVYVYDPVTDPSASKAMMLPAGSVIDVTLRPLTPLIDGTMAQPVTTRVSVVKATGPSTIGEVGSLTDVPLARYEASATVTDPAGKATDLLVGATCSRSGCPLKPPPLAAIAEIRFVPADALVHSRPFQGQAVAGVYLYMHTP
jgi:hypothetical protein